MGAYKRGICSGVYIFQTGNVACMNEKPTEAFPCLVERLAFIVSALQSLIARLKLLA